MGAADGGDAEVAVDGFGVSAGSPFAGAADLKERIVSAYRKAVETPLGSPESMWLAGALFELKRDVHERLTSNDPDAVRRLLADPGSSDLLYGFEDNAKSLPRPLDRTARLSLVLGGWDQLLLLAEAIGVARIRTVDASRDTPSEGEALLERLDAAFGFRLEFPNPYPGEAGLD
ncbi:MAG: hypothetical protein JO209_10295, partial [Acidisphaera sp.]|nr:hypothetical protein [Acidisphaera sp.]